MTPAEIDIPFSTPLDDAETPKDRRHFPILDALYSTFDAYDSNLESAYYADYDQLRDGSGWPYASGSGALMYVEQVSTNKLRKRGRELVIEVGETQSELLNLSD